MSTGNWDPEINAQRKALSIEPAFLTLFIKISADDQLDVIADQLTKTQLETFPALIELSIEDWQDAVKNLSNDDIWQLIRFWTVAEKSLVGWECGDKSPVIALNKLLKKRKKALSKEQLTWIKSTSNNHFLPNGPLLM
ncbi:hypothetical protein EDC56_1604 [Sinobacterium caligoides]|uniref:Uncharacterized protein n=1 Tax=Sinobacterium caligoides TaxID=933926 RepID=A0A3N2DMY6_9GAMM|nr:hypothetical protein [Sinobacterium caligoides]ROS01176.1 hypothetical protein EDC56_1604 [Sinobacterium caligoides]